MNKDDEVEGEGDGKAGEGPNKAGDDNERGGGDGTLKTSCDVDMQPVDLNPVSDESRRASDKLQASGKAGIESVIIDILGKAARLAGQAVKAIDVAHIGGADPVVAALAQEAQRASKLRSQAARVLRSNDSDSWTRRLSVGRMDRFALPRVASGDYTNPFAKHARLAGYETEIAIVLDGSGSMGSRKLHCAAVLALVVAQAAEQVGVQCEIVQFSHSVLRQVKAPREKLSQAKARKRLAVGSMDNGGGTPLSASIALMAAKLRERAAHKRKMVFAITDGACDCGSDAVRAIAAHCARTGVEVVGLSIDSRTHGAFKHEVRVDSFGDVAGVGLGVLVKALEDRPGDLS
jgi:Mg-chelatase subunit ChlD